MSTALTDLRDYQQEAFEEITRLMTAAALGQAGGSRRPLLVAPTGAGKNTISAYMIWRALQKKKRILFIVAGRQIVDEFSQRLEKQYQVQHGVIMRGHWRRNPSWPVQVCSIDTLASMVRRGEQLPPADLILVDEADLVVAPRFTTVLEKYPDAFVVGQTATPVRADGKGLHAAFDRIVVAATPRGLIDRGFLSDYDYINLELSIDAETLKSAATSDLAAERAYDEMSDAKRAVLNGNIVEKWHEYAAGRRTVGFAMNVKHSLNVVERFNAERVHGAPICKAEHVDGSTPWEERQAIIARIHSGETLVVSNVGILGRGVDIPSLECVGFWRPTASLALYMQQAGRGLRTFPGKEKALFLDHVGNYNKHGLPCKAREWSLEDGVVERGDGDLVAIVNRTCAKCRAIYPARMPLCPRCGVAPEAKPQQVEIKELANVVATPVHLAGSNAPAPAGLALSTNDFNYLKWHMRTAIAKGHKPRSVGHQFSKGDKSRMPSDAVLAQVAAGLGWEWQAERGWQPLQKRVA